MELAAPLGAGAGVVVSGAVESPERGYLVGKMNDVKVQLTRAKEWVEDGLITQEDYDGIKTSVLNAAFRM